jgi:Domain of unknown function (DUF4347)/FG-GAP-like repeat/FG-GAP repeat
MGGILALALALSLAGVSVSAAKSCKFSGINLTMLHTQNRSIAHKTNTAISLDQAVSAIPDSENRMLRAECGRTGVATVNTLVVFDDRVSDLEILYQALLPGSIGFTISSQDDGLEEITRLLKETGAEFLSIVAHGEPGVIHLGKNPISIEQLQAQAHLLKSWGIAEIALYSCEVAKHDVGKHFIYQLSELTGATVAASDTKTGCAKLDGNWNLAITTGNIAAPIPFEATIFQNYPAILISVALVAGMNSVEGGLLGTFEISLDAPATAGGIIVNFTTTGTTATPNLDYALSAGAGITAITANTFTIAAGATKATINVVAFRDAVIDPNEIITINTTAGIGYTIGSFTAPTDFAVGSTTSSFNSMTVGDFNGDGKLDLATANYTSNNVSVLLGNGGGGFAAATNFNVGTNPNAVTVGDFNGDGKLDLATANYTSNNVSVLLGNGSDGFTAATNFNVGTNPNAVTVGDFNGDGKLDLATANLISNNVSVLLGNGGGGFAAATNFTVGTNPGFLTVGDFNGDGKLDLATANYNSNNVSVLLGNGGGGFTAATNFNVGTTPISVTVGDFNGDGKLDLATANQSSSNVSVLLGNGGGGFAAATNFIVGTNPNTVTVGDFNSDGKPDLATSNFNSSSVSVLLGNGGGDFTPATNFTVGTNPRSITVGDFNSDGKPDLSTANYSLGNVSVLLNNDVPTASIGIFDTPFARRNDFGKDYKSDILWRNTNGALAIWQMNGANVLANNVISGVDNTWKVSGTGDFNGDGKSDILWRNDNGATSLWLMNGATALYTSSLNPYPIVDNTWKIASTNDFNGDKKTDVLWRNDNGALAIWQMNGSTTLSNKIFSSIDSTWKLASTGDFNGDAKADILWRNDNGAIALWQMDGSTLLSTTFVSSAGLLDWKIQGVDDFNGDGKVDILIRNNNNGGVRLWSMDGATITNDSYVAGNTADWKISGTGDFNGDGKADILWRNDNGAAAIWGMNGAAVVSADIVATIANSWSVVAPVL